MAGLGIGIMFVGYSVMYYGMTQIGIGAKPGEGGGNWGLLDLIVPGRWEKASGIARDSGNPPTNPTGTLGQLNNLAKGLGLP